MTFNVDDAALNCCCKFDASVVDVVDVVVTTDDVVDARVVVVVDVVVVVVAETFNVPTVTADV